MKKKLDAMTVISILLIVINLVLFFVATVTGDSCSGEVELASQMSLLSFGQLFGGTVYAAGLPINISKVNYLSGIMRSNDRFYKSYK